jgi:iron uptake system component EfeO
VRRLALAAAAAVALAIPLTAACTTNSSDDGQTAGAGDPAELTVTSTDEACDVSADSAPSGNLVFTVTNDGTEVTEFYLYGKDGLRIVGEVENIGPGLSRDVVLRAAPGEYVTACKPGMVGDGIRDAFTVTDSGAGLAAQGPDRVLVETANAQYAGYVRDQTDQLVAGTRRFARRYLAGDDDAARALYAPTRVHWERIEPVAESFGDLDPRLDLRQADLEPGQEWTGWHRIEKDLWPPSARYRAMSAEQRRMYADLLVADTEELRARVQDLAFTADQIGNGAKGLLDEVATGKVTGEEEIWSHTDLWDFQANVDGARVAFEGLRPVLHRKDAELESLIDQRFTSLQELLDAHRTADGFVLYTSLGVAEVRQLSDSVNALSEPLSQLTAAVTL